MAAAVPPSPTTTQGRHVASALMHPKLVLHPRYWPTWIGLALMRFISFLPLSVSHALGGRLGALAYRTIASRRDIVDRNLAACFPEWSEARRREVARAHFRAAGRATLDAGLAWWVSRRRLRAAVSVRGREHLDSALEEGGPVILLVGHFVGLEIGGLYLTTEQKMATIYKKPKNELFRHFMVRGRRRFGDTTLIERKDGFREVIKALRRREPLYYLPDQDPGNMNTKFVFAPFLGVQTATVTGFSRLAERTGAVVVPCFTRLLPSGVGYEIEFRPPMTEYPTGDPGEDARRMNAEIEAGVREAPEQYLWTHRRFKTRPPGETPFYR